ncbi:hypothetical protein TWF128_007911 [Orbilia oligospora]|nr:hypothetical protein TWF128_007911 [Orbilia oligospora]
MDSDDILGLLAVAEHINIDFLPFQCDNSNPIGIGGTAKITRGAKTSTNRGDKEYNFGLVFKRTQSEIEYKNRAEVFRAVLSEVYILGHPVVRHHPNISSLQGICWEIIHNEPWPVLIFKQAPYGDLSQFMKSGIELEFKDKIKICWEIGNALQLMHKCTRQSPADTKAELNGPRTTIGRDMPLANKKAPRSSRPMHPRWFYLFWTVHLEILVNARLSMVSSVVFFLMRKGPGIRR